jgi:hypothetical protein
MVDLVTTAAAIGAPAVGLIDKMADQIERFVTGRSSSGVPVEHRLRIKKSGDDIVTLSHGS